MGRTVLICVMALLPAVARADQTMSSVAVEHDRLYLAPGLQFGARSQELSLTLGASAVSKVEAEAGYGGGSGLSEPLMDVR